MGFTTNRGALAALSHRFSARLPGVSDRRLFLLGAAPLLAVYLLTATWSLPLNKDTFTNTLTAWNVGTTGSFLLEEHAGFVDDETWGWLVEARDSVASQYPPGAALLAVPLYSVWPAQARAFPLVDEAGKGMLDQSGDPATGLIPPIAPATIVAAIATAAAMGLLSVVFRRLGSAESTALVAAWVAGLATAAWSVASDQLWQHGPAMAWLALGLVLSERQMMASGFAFGAAILTRPPLALIPAAVGLSRGISRRSLRPVITVGIGAGAGLAAFVAYNVWIFGTPSLSAGYGTSFESNVFSGTGESASALLYARSLLGAAVSPDRGLFVYSPFLLMLLPGLRVAWRAAPSWARGSAVGGVLYLLLQYKANRYSGGTYFLTYRYPLEALVAAAPLLFLSYVRWVKAKPRRVVLFSLAATVSISLQALASIGVAPL